MARNDNVPHLYDMSPQQAEEFLRQAEDRRRAAGWTTDGDLTVMDWFCGAGGSSQGMHSIPGVRMERAANHWERAIESHAANFPEVDHYRGDIREAPVDKWPVTDIFWASPECPQWSNARGKKRDFDASLQGDLFDGFGPSEEVERSRALMEEVPMYLRGVQQRGGLVKAGVVENVVDVRAWDQWDRWIGEIRKLGYETRVIALNSMHADPRTVHKAPQSRDRLYVAYWHKSLGRTPDWDKWLRPRAWCTGCDTWVQAVQRFKQPGRDMGRYRQQYVYRCPNVACRNQIVEPETLPAAVAIDWTIAGQRIGDRTKPLADKTLARIQAGLDKFARPMMVPAGGTWRNDATPVDDPMATRTTRENDGLAVPPLLIPVEGRDGKEPASAHAPLRTQTARNETGLAWLPFMVTMRGGGDQLRGRSIHEALGTVSANGNHHGLVTPENVDWQSLLVPYYGNGNARPVREPVGTLSTRDRYALVQGDVDINDVLFRMLEPHEIGRAMSFADAYIVLGSKRERVRQYGNAVTPNCAEVIVCALVEAITGDDIERHTEPQLAIAA
jgi:DNA (cytosine-5)-methyltransferase 1